MIEVAQGDDEVGAENPYKPGEAAIDPAGSGAGPGEPNETISPGRPEKPTLSRAYANFKVLLNRSIGKIGVAWLLLGGLYLVAIVAWAFITGSPPFGTEAPPSGEPEPISAAILTVVAWGFVVVFIGLTRPLREVGFRGEGAMAGLGTVYARAFERFWSIVGLVVIGAVLVSIPTMALGYLAMSTRLPVAGNLVAVPLALVLYFLLSPAFYIVPASDLSLADSLGASFRVVRDFPGYLLMSHLVLIGGGLAMGCFFVGTMLVPFVGLVCGPITLIFVYFGLWVAYTSIFATIDEVRGGFGEEPP